MRRSTRVLVILMAVMVMTLIVSNIAATKIWSLLGIPADGGLIVFPISYIVSDMLVELYGRKIANFVAIMAMLMNLVAMLFFIAVVNLPAYSGWDGQNALASVLGFSVRISVASLTSFLLSSITNNYVFTWMRKRSDKYVVRALSSSLVGRIVDVMIFELVAFFGVLSFQDFIIQAIGAYAEGQLVEIAFLVIVKDNLTRHVRWWAEDDGSYVEPEE